MQTTEITQQNPQISKTNVLWGKEELFFLWESLSFLWLLNFSSSLGLSAVFGSLFAASWCPVSFAGEVFMQMLSFKSVNHLWCLRDEYVGLFLCLHCSAERELQPTQTGWMGTCINLSTPEWAVPLTSGPLLELIWIKPYSTHQGGKTVNFNLTQVPICLSITAVAIYLLWLSLTATQCGNFLHVPLDVLLYYCLQSAEARFCICRRACWEMSPLWSHLFQFSHFSFLLLVLQLCNFWK